MCVLRPTQHQRHGIGLLCEHGVHAGMAPLLSGSRSQWVRGVMRIDPLDLLLGQLLHRQYGRLIVIVVRGVQRGCERVVRDFVRRVRVCFAVDGKELLVQVTLIHLGGEHKASLAQGKARQGKARQGKARQGNIC